MSCENWRMEISAFIDSELSDEEQQALYQHLAACVDCRGFLRDTRIIHGALQVEDEDVEKIDQVEIADGQPFYRRRLNVSFASVALMTFLACLCSFIIGVLLEQSRLFTLTPVTPSNVQTITEQMRSPKESHP